MIAYEDTLNVSGTLTPQNCSSQTSSGLSIMQKSPFLAEPIGPQASAALWWQWYRQHLDHTRQSARQLIGKDEPLGDRRHHRRPFVPARILPVHLLLCQQAHIAGIILPANYPLLKYALQNWLRCRGRPPTHVSHFSPASERRGVFHRAGRATVKWGNWLLA